MAQPAAPFPYRSPPGLSAPEPRHPVVVVGAGPVGLAAALDLAGQGVRVVLVDDNDVVSTGSRAICWSKRSLEILDRLGVGAACVEKGVTWKIGRTFHGETEVFRFDLQPEPGHKMPAFVNLQQYHVEALLAEKARAHPLIDLRFRNLVTAVRPEPDHVALRIDTPEGAYSLEADWLVSCDGAKSPVRGMLGLDFAGELFEERFLIADIEMKADFPPERWFWFAPPFHDGQSALLHKQPDDIWRIDLQLGPDADAELERRPERVIPRIARMLGHEDFRLDWVSVYSFHCRRLARFVHGRVIFAGDSAHVVSPFGARGGNGGLQDVDALGWRLAAVVEGRAAPSILADYDAERQWGADENILNSSRTTRFMTPGEGFERVLRDAVLGLAGRAPFARRLVNSGRLSVPCVYPLDAPNDRSLPLLSRPGAVAPDAPLPGGWLIDRLGGRPVALAIGMVAPEVAGLDRIELEPSHEVRTRYLGEAPWALYLIRPDQVVAARWVEASAAGLRRALEAIWGRR
jgi:3-(3-hydroxy-phenyl)propionate hydroxylase